MGGPSELSILFLHPWINVKYGTACASDVTSPAQNSTLYDNKLPSHQNSCLSDFSALSNAPAARRAYIWCN